MLHISLTLLHTSCERIVLYEILATVRQMRSLHRIVYYDHYYYYYCYYNYYKLLT